MLARRGLIGVGALLLALIALYVLFNGGRGEERARVTERAEPALDDIDAKSRNELRDLLREAGSEN